MKTFKIGRALALPATLCSMSTPAFADTEAAQILAIGQRADEHGPAGTMGDHVHKGGEFMIGMMWMHDEFGGTNVSGTSEISDAAIAAAGYSVRTRSMTMDMAMLHIMWAPSDRVTFMVMPSWMRMDMTMLGIGAPMDPAMDSAMAHEGHHTLMPGQTMSHSVSGIGDTEVGALVSLSRRHALSAHAGLAVSVPTGSVSRRNANGDFVHYGMQPGSGTWDLIPSFTLTGGNGRFGWGAQTRYRFRAEDRNKSGFRFGDRFDATAWVSKPLSPAASLAARIAWRDEGAIKGHYNGAHGHASPPDRQENYGGKVVEAGLGANLVLGAKWRLGAEAMLPLHQDLNGIQAPKKFGASLSLSRMF